MLIRYLLYMIACLLIFGGCNSRAEFRLNGSLKVDTQTIVEEVVIFFEGNIRNANVDDIDDVVSFRDKVFFFGSNQQCTIAVKVSQPDQWEIFGVTAGKDSENIKPKYVTTQTQSEVYDFIREGKTPTATGTQSKTTLSINWR